ncbi:hypothetical protein D3C87_888320 [compost metagenome]
MTSVQLHYNTLVDPIQLYNTLKGNFQEYEINRAISMLLDGNLRTAMSGKNKGGVLRDANGRLIEKGNKFYKTLAFRQLFGYALKRDLYVRQNTINYINDLIETRNYSQLNEVLSGLNKPQEDEVFEGGITIPKLRLQIDDRAFGILCRNAIGIGDTISINLLLDYLNRTWNVPYYNTGDRTFISVGGDRINKIDTVKEVVNPSSGSIDAFLMNVKERSLDSNELPVAGEIEVVTMFPKYKEILTFVSFSDRQNQVERLFLESCFETLINRNDVAIAKVVGAYTKTFVKTNDSIKQFIRYVYDASDEVMYELLRNYKFDPSFRYGNFNFREFFKRGKWNFLIALPGIWDTDTLINFINTVTKGSIDTIGYDNDIKMSQFESPHPEVYTKRMYESNIELWYERIETFLSAYKIIDCFKSFLNVGPIPDLYVYRVYALCNIELYTLLAASTILPKVKLNLSKSKFTHPYVYDLILQSIDTPNTEGLKRVNDIIARSSQIDMGLLNFQIPNEIVNVQDDPLKLNAILNYFNVQLIPSIYIFNSLMMLNYTQMYILSRTLLVTDLTLNEYFSNIDTPEMRLLVISKLRDPNAISLENFAKLCGNNEVQAVNSLVSKNNFNKQKYIDFLGNYVDYLSDEIINVLNS